MFVVLFVRTVKLQVNAVLACFLRRFTKLDVLGITNAGRRGENAVKTDLLCICN